MLDIYIKIDLYIGGRPAATVTERGCRMWQIVRIPIAIFFVIAVMINGTIQAVDVLQNQPDSKVYGEAQGVIAVVIISLLLIAAYIGVKTSKMTIGQQRPWLGLIGIASLIVGVVGFALAGAVSLNS